MRKRCSEIQEFLSDYLDNELESTVRVDFDLHIGDCEPCRRFLDTTRRCVHLYQNLEYDDIPVELKDRLKSFLAQLPKPKP